jgi:hypothetical protein
VTLLTQKSFDFTRIRQIRVAEVNKEVPIPRNRKFDRCAQDLPARSRSLMPIPLSTSGWATSAFNLEKQYELHYQE